ncbi:MAG: hypothetical protein ACI84C_002576, partial [Flavobacteriales bacterium]
KRFILLEAMTSNGAYFGFGEEMKQQAWRDILVLIHIFIAFELVVPDALFNAIVVGKHFNRV